MQPMALTFYRVFAQRDGRYGVALSQLGAMVRTATGFAAVAEAQAWIEHDRQMDDADNPFRECDPCDPQAH